MGAAQHGSRARAETDRTAWLSAACRGARRDLESGGQAAGRDLSRDRAGIEPADLRWTRLGAFGIRNERGFSHRARAARSQAWRQLYHASPRGAALRAR